SLVAEWVIHAHTSSTCPKREEMAADAPRAEPRESRGILLPSTARRDRCPRRRGRNRRRGGDVRRCTDFPTRRSTLPLRRDGARESASPAPRRAATSRTGAPC